MIKKQRGQVKKIALTLAVDISGQRGVFRFFSGLCGSGRSWQGSGEDVSQFFLFRVVLGHRQAGVAVEEAGAGILAQTDRIAGVLIGHAADADVLLQHLDPKMRDVLADRDVLGTVEVLAERFGREPEVRGNVVDGHDARDVEAEERFDMLHAQTQLWGDSGFRADEALYNSENRLSPAREKV